MKTNIYAVKDEVALDFPFIFEAINDGMMKRVVKGALLSKERNVFTDNLKDKVIFQIGERETKTGVITALEQPLFIFSVAELRLELIKEIKIAKAEAGEEHPEAPEVISDGE